jgi:hypothetical protein
MVILWANSVQLRAGGFKISSDWVVPSRGAEMGNKVYYDQNKFPDI